MKTLLCVCIALILPMTAFSQQGPDQQEAASSSSAKLFTRSIVYGALAGTLVGFATLAFTSNPGGNLNNVARGASYGLYAGILLGAYVAYGLSEEAPTGEQGPSLYEGGAPEGEPLPPGTNVKKEFPVISMVPVLDNQSNGVGLGGLLQGSFRF